MDYTVIIGLEVHVQLLTKTKLFSSEVNLFNPEHPNTQTTPVSLGMPGTLPVMNQQAFRLAVKAALALNCDIARYTKWDRKQYFYPDLPKGYQISQYDMPFSSDGWLDIAVDPESDETSRVRILRAHLEEDAGKNLHDESGRGRESRVDLNRVGTPLIEIVSEPDLRSGAEARVYMEEIRRILTYLEVSDCNMQEGSLRCDANVNLHIHADDGHKIPTPIVEVKNMNSSRNVELAIEYEAKRQFEEFKRTGQKMGDVPKQTRGWDADRNITFAQRSKEEASDYRYFPDPDLVPVTVDDAFLEEVRAEMCELPADRLARFQVAYQLSYYDANVIIDHSRQLADYFEEAAEACGDGKQTANWVTQDVLRELNERGMTIGEFPLRPAVLGALLKKIVAEEITVKSAREVFKELLAGAEPSVERIDAIIEEQGLQIVSDTGELDAVIAAIVEKNPKAVTDFQSGKQGAVGPLIGQVMREVKGADPKTVRQMIIDKLS